MSDTSAATGSRWALAVCLGAVFLALLDVTIVNVAFPSIQRSFHSASLPELTWVLNLYNVLIAALLIPAGRLADRYGQRRLFCLGLSGFILGSALCAAAPSAPALIGARGVQALGASFMVPTSLSLLLLAFGHERRTVAASLWAAAGAVASATGPSLGGTLVDLAGWRWVFILNIPLGAGLLLSRRALVAGAPASGPAAAWAVPGTTLLTPGRAPLPDPASAGLLAGGVGLLALGIVQGPDWGWGGGRVLGSLGVGCGLLIALALRTRRVPAPIIEPSLLAIRSFSVAGAALCMYSVGFYAFLLANVLFMTEVWHYSLLTAGFALTPGPLLAAVTAGPAGKLAVRIGHRWVVIAGAVVFAMACLLYVRLCGVHPSYLSRWLPAQVVAGIGIGVTFAGLTGAAVTELPATMLATGTATSACLRQLGGVLGVATLAAVLGHPAPAHALAGFHHAWALIAAGSLLAAMIALALPAVGATVSHPAVTPRLAGASLR